MSKVHSILGASSCHRWMSCPGSVRLSAGLPKRSTTYSQEGNAAHDLAEMCLRDNTDAAAHVGALITVEENAYEVTEEMADAVQIYLDLVRSELLAAGRGAELKIEQQFTLDWLREGLWGTADAVICQPFGKIITVDFKYGAGVAVDVTDNSQLKYYAAGVAHGEPFDEIELIIVQPRAQHHSGPIRRYSLSANELEKWANEVLLPGAEATESPDAPLCVGGWCKFCPAMAICPAQKQVAVKSAQFAFQEKPEAPPLAAGMTPDELRNVLDKADMIEAWLNACRAHVRTMLENGMATPEELGYKLVAGRASRKWLNEEDAVSFLTTLDIDPYEHKLKSPSQAEKALKGPAKKALEDMVQTTRGTQLAPISDKKEALPSAISAFGEVDI